MDKPRVKPLVWEMVSPNVFDSLGVGILYRVRKRSVGTAELQIDTTRPGKPYESLTSAKAAAQADFEARILAALEPVTVQDERERIASIVETWRNDVPMTGKECAAAIRALAERGE